MDFFEVVIKDLPKNIVSHVDSVAPQQENYKPFSGKLELKLTVIQSTQL